MLRMLRRRAWTGCPPVPRPAAPGAEAGRPPLKTVMNMYRGWCVSLSCPRGRSASRHGQVEGMQPMWTELCCYAAATPSHAACPFTLSTFKQRDHHHMIAKGGKHEKCTWTRMEGGGGQKGSRDGGRCTQHPHNFSAEHVVSECTPGDIRQAWQGGAWEE